MQNGLIFAVSTTIRPIVHITPRLSVQLVAFTYPDGRTDWRSTTTTVGARGATATRVRKHTSERTALMYVGAMRLTAALLGAVGKGGATRTWEA